MITAKTLFERDYNAFLHFSVAALYFLLVSLVVFFFFGLIYQRLMRHWHRTLPGFVLDIDYGQLVRDTGSAARRLLEFCGLPYEAACLDTTANDSPVATLSSAQVRAPIHQRSAGEWRRYERQLDPLRRMLLPG